jgi:hypothetical protein
MSGDAGGPQGIERQNLSRTTQPRRTTRGGKLLHRAGCRRGERHAAVDRYLRAFEAGRLPEAICADRLRDLERKLAGLAARKAALESLGAQALVLPDDGDLRQLRDRIRLAVAQAAPEQLKLLLAAVVDRITVESRACIQPYFTAPGVRTLGGSRRRTGKHTNHGAPGPTLWVSTRAWSRID